MNEAQDFPMCCMSAMKQPIVGQVPLNTGPGLRGALPLTLLGAGASGRISFLRGPAGLVRHITELGFVEGAEIKVVSGNSGNLIIELKGSRLAIDRQVATHIIVTQ